MGIHNTLEAAVYGIPVIFGPKYQKFQEAIQLLEAKGAFSVKDYEELKTLLDRMLTDEVFLRESGMNASNYVTGNAGATDKIMSMINFKKVKSDKSDRGGKGDGMASLLSPCLFGAPCLPFICTSRNTSDSCVQSSGSAPWPAPDLLS